MLVPVGERQRRGAVHDLEQPERLSPGEIGRVVGKDVLVGLRTEEAHHPEREPVPEVHDRSVAPVEVL